MMTVIDSAFFLRFSLRIASPSLRTLPSGKTFLLIFGPRLESLAQALAIYDVILIFRHSVDGVEVEFGGGN